MDIRSDTKSAQIAALIAQQLLQRIIRAVREDQANRYALREPWTLPRLTERIPDYEGKLIVIRDSVITVQPYSGDVSDGCTLAPDRIGAWRPVIGAIFHDPWYLEMRAISRHWGPPWTLGRVRRLGDQVFYGILIIVTPSWIARTYYRFVRVIGGVAHFTMQIVAVASVVAICCAGCAGCDAPESPFEDPNDFNLPDYEQTAGGAVE